MRSRQGGPAWGTLGLIAFLFCDVILVAAALAHVRDDGTAPASSTVTQPESPGTSGSSSAEPSVTSPSPDATTSSPSAAARLAIVAVDATHAWRFATGSCADGGATLEVTADGGASWETRVAPFGATSRVRVRPDGSAFAVGGAPDKGCDPQIRQSPDQAKTWGVASRVTDAWYRDLRKPTRIGTASGSSATPCGKVDVLELAVPEGETVVLCGDGRVTQSTDGATWKVVGVVKGGLTLASSGQGVMVVRAGGSTCDGLALVEASATDQLVGCLQGVDEATAGEVSLSVAGDTWWLRVGARTWRSSGGPADWRAS